jgi:hypothetical protein
MILYVVDRRAEQPVMRKPLFDIVDRNHGMPFLAGGRTGARMRSAR